MKSFRSGSQAYESPDSHGSWDWFPLALCFGTAISKSFSVKDRETKKHPKTAKLSVALQKMTSFSLKNFTCPAEREHPHCTNSHLFILKDRFILQYRVHHLLASKGSPIYLIVYNVFLYLSSGTWEDNLQQHLPTVSCPHQLHNLTMVIATQNVSHLHLHSI